MLLCEDSIFCTSGRIEWPVWILYLHQSIHCFWSARWSRPKADPLYHSPDIDTFYHMGYQTHVVFDQHISGGRVRLLLQRFRYGFSSPWDSGFGKVFKKATPHILIYIIMQRRLARCYSHKQQPANRLFSTWPFICKTSRKVFPAPPYQSALIHGHPSRLQD